MYFDSCGCGGDLAAGYSTGCPGGHRFGDSMPSSLLIIKIWYIKIILVIIIPSNYYIIHIMYSSEYYAPFYFLFTASDNSIYIQNS